MRRAIPRPFRRVLSRSGPQHTVCASPAGFGARRDGPCGLVAGAVGDEMERSMVMSRLVVGNPVDGRDGPLGTVAGTRAATDGLQQEYVLVRLSQVFGLLHTTRLVPLAWVRSAPPDAPRVTLDASRAEVAGCPPLRPDAQLEAAVAQALSETVGGFDAPTMRATAQDGVVTLSGHAPSLRARRTAVSCAWDVPGVLEVLDRSVYDG